MEFCSVPKYTLKDILAVASVHPFYNSNTCFPPTQAQINEVISNGRNKQCPDLTNWPLTQKDHLYALFPKPMILSLTVPRYQKIQRLVADDAPNNVFRHASYISSTGGGSGSLPMLYLTDAVENRMQRLAMGKLFRQCGVIVPGDCIVTMHASGNLYR
jgi:hypothetical protein